MHVLVTRPEEDAASLAAALSARGHEPHLEPLLRIEPAPGVPTPLDLDGVQAILFTSANGVRALAHLSPDRGLPVFTVGNASAEAARAAGFTEVASAAGDVEDLARLVAARLKPKDGAVYHGAGQRLAGDLKERLEGDGFTLRRVVLYRAHAASDLSRTTRTALLAHHLDAVTLFSPRTAATFVKLVQKADLAVACPSLDAVCLSPAVAEKLGVLSWRSVRIAAHPTQEALLDCIDGLTGPRLGKDRATIVERTMSGQDNADNANADDANADDKNADSTSAAHQIIAKFGGIRPMANKLDVAVSTVQGWRERASIPASRHGQIQAAAEAHKIEIDRDTLAASDHAPEGHAEAASDQSSAKPSHWIPKSGRKQGPMSEALAPGGDNTGNTPGTSPAKARQGGAFTGAFLIAALVFTLGAGTAVLTREAWMPYLPATQDEDPNGARLEALELDLAALAAKISRLQDDNPALGRIADLETRLSELASQPSGTTGTSGLREARAETAKLRREVSNLASRLESLSKTASASGDSEQLGAALARIEARNTNTEQGLGALRDQLAALARTRGPSGNQTAMTLAVLQVRDALRGAEPFTIPLATLESLLAESPNSAALDKAIAPLRPYAASGAPSLKSLQAAFPAVARKVIAQSHGGEGDGLLANVVRRFSNLVSIRPTGPVEGGGAAAIVARAEAQLEAGDLASAVRELDSLSGPASDAAREWRDEAQARLTLQAALERLGALISGQG